MKPDLSQVFETLNPRFARATQIASEQLTKLGVPHALIGGMAVGAYGYVRATRDVDFLVGEQAFDRQGPILSFKEGMPLEVDGVKVDLVPVPEDLVLSGWERFSEGIPVITIPDLFILKLYAWRRRDQNDLLELLRAGVSSADVMDAIERGFETDSELSILLLNRLCDLDLILEEEDG